MEKGRMVPVSWHKYSAAQGQLKERPYDADQGNNIKKKTTIHGRAEIITKYTTHWIDFQNVLPSKADISISYCNWGHNFLFVLCNKWPNKCLQATHQQRKQKLHGKHRSDDSTIIWCVPGSCRKFEQIWDEKDFVRKQFFIFIHQHNFKWEFFRNTIFFNKNFQASHQTTTIASLSHYFFRLPTHEIQRKWASKITIQNWLQIRQARKWKIQHIWGGFHRTVPFQIVGKNS